MSLNWNQNKLFCKQKQFFFLKTWWLELDFKSFWEAIFLKASFMAWMLPVLAPGTAPDTATEHLPSLLHSYFRVHSNAVVHVLGKGQRPPTHTPTPTHPPRTRPLFFLSSLHRTGAHREQEWVSYGRSVGCSATGREAAADIRLIPASKRVLLDNTFFLTLFGDRFVC